MRVSELLTENKKKDKHVVGLKDVDEVITVMGQPEDYIIEENNQSSQKKHYSATIQRGEQKIIPRYRKRNDWICFIWFRSLFWIDKVWIRVVLLSFCFGTGVLAYIILWIIMPEAKPPQKN
jgi:hypothetical protein